MSYAWQNGQTNRQTDKLTDRQTDGKTDRQTDKRTYLPKLKILASNKDFDDFFFRGLLN